MLNFESLHGTNNFTISICSAHNGQYGKNNKSVLKILKIACVLQLKQLTKC